MLTATIGRWRSSPFAVKITRYALGSVVALGTSVVTFAILYVAPRRYDDGVRSPPSSPGRSRTGC